LEFLSQIAHIQFLDVLITLNSVLSIVAPYEMYIVMYTS